MADLIPVQSGDAIFGGGSGGIGGLFAGMLMANMMRGQNMVGTAEAVVGNNPVLQAMNQQQLASATQIMTQDINRVGHDIATSAGATQMAVANGTLQSTVATLQGQSALTSAVDGSTIQNLNSHSNILQSVAAGNSATAA